jgi:hypothetical protein
MKSKSLAELAQSLLVLISLNLAIARQTGELFDVADSVEIYEGFTLVKKY